MEDQFTCQPDWNKIEGRRGNVTYTSTGGWVMAEEYYSGSDYIGLYVNGILVFNDLEGVETTTVYVGKGDTYLLRGSPWRYTFAPCKEKYTPPTNPVNDEHTLLLLRGEDFTDSSQYKRAVTNNGSAITADGKFGKAFKGSGAQSVKVEIPALGTGDYTIDFWTRMDGVANFGRMCGTSYGSSINSNGVAISTRDTSRQLRFFYQSGTTPNVNESSYTIPLDTWVHVALVRHNGVSTLYANGVSQTQSTGSINLPNAPINLFTANDNLYYYNGAIDEFRVSNIARWTGNFTPPTAPYNK